DALAFQALNGLAAASGLFFVAAGLSLIFGVTRIVNMAHGSLYMVGLYLAYTIATALGGGAGYFAGVAGAALGVAALGAVIEVVLLRRIYHMPDLFQLIATFALVLIISDATLWLWGPEDLLGPRAPQLRGAVEVLGRRFPSYDLMMIAIGPVVLAILHLTLARTRFGRLVRAATEDGEMAGALGVNQALLFTAVFAAGSLLSGLGGALQLAREPANLTLDLTVLGDAFVVVVTGGMGSIAGAYLAAVLIAEAKTLCIGIGTVHIGGFLGSVVGGSAGSFDVNFSKLTLAAEFIVMAAVLILRPHGLLGGAAAPARAAPETRPRALSAPMKIGAAALALALAALAAQRASPYALVLGTDVLIAVIFAVSLHFIMGPGGMHSFGHAAYFGLGAYGAALTVKFLHVPMPAALLAAVVVSTLGAVLFGWFAVRLSGIYLAMLTFAFAQIVWSIVFEWEDVTGGSNGVLGIWPDAPFDAAWLFYLLTLAVAAAVVAALRVILFSPFGFALRAGRDQPQRAEAIGIDVRRVRWVAFALAGGAAGLAGGLFAFAKGSISPETVHVSRSIDAIVMVLLGGLQSLGGPAVGAAVFTTLQDTVMRQTEYWRALLGAVILILVLLFPGGIAGSLARAAAAVGAGTGRKP
ncbi:MAG: ABC transporter permease, partial [Bradyrhizobiaceae bacterium]|nr:ABC transporter permease [Bradyrhizobiaceae bacterium]